LAGRYAADRAGDGRGVPDDGSAGSVAGRTPVTAPDVAAALAVVVGSLR
jgi:hypothetical protein